MSFIIIYNLLITLYLYISGEYYIINIYYLYLYIPNVNHKYKVIYK